MVIITQTGGANAERLGNSEINFSLFLQLILFLYDYII